MERAQKKLSSKFSNLPSHELGFVARVYRYTAENSNFFTYMNDVTKDVQGAKPNMLASVYWLATAAPTKNPKDRYLRIVNRHVLNPSRPS